MPVEKRRPRSAQNDGLEVIGQSETVRRLGRLIDEAHERVWLVTPYSTLEKLRNLTRSIQRALSRGVVVELVLREPDPSTRHSNASARAIGELITAGLKLYSVRDLHAKLYVSDRNAILTSLNLLDSSFNNSIEVGIWIPGNSELLAQARNFFSSEIEPHLKEATPANLLTAPQVTLQPPATSMRFEPKGAILPPSGVVRAQKRPRGFCIACAGEIPLNPDRPYCAEDYAQHRSSKNGLHCHRCGNLFATTSDEPMCEECFAAWMSED